MTYVKSLHFNKPDEMDIQFHRTHRSKKGRNNWNVASNEAVFIYKKKKIEKKLEIDDEELALLNVKV